MFYFKKSYVLLYYGNIQNRVLHRWNTSTVHEGFSINPPQYTHNTHKHADPRLKWEGARGSIIHIFT